MKETEDMLASELNKLSLQERTKALEDIHCVGQDLEETPELVEELLAEFDRTAQQQEQHDPTYKMIAKRYREYIEDPSFRLKFIRSNTHNVGKAVNQMLHFLRNKAKYFGNDCIGREITIHDLNEEDRELLLSGIYHIQKDKDQKGRVILYFFSEFLGSAKAETFCRVAYYVYFNILIPIPEVQMKGLVNIFYDVSKVDELPLIPNMNLALTIMDMVTSLPIRFSARHYCLKARQEKLDLFNSLLQSLFKSCQQSYGKVRSRMHYGSDIELQYQLRSHGINTDSSPINPKGGLREDIRNDWLYDHLRRERTIIAYTPSIQPPPSEEPNVDVIAPDELWLPRAKAGDVETFHHTVDHDAKGLIGRNGKAHGISESRVSQAGADEKHHRSSNIIENAPITPTFGDIFLGRGRVLQNVPGNIHFRKLATEYKDEYEKAPPRRRKEIVSEVGRVLSTDGRRFLKQTNTGAWVKSSDKEAKTKIAQFFRDFRKK
ncbi:unnamed protein product [Cylindrotheca closterium]|uniref:DUF6824 domain-containing protein n=1 Tax=Cylindrotheca closterium TaxID=2856 RepID=A0AAD2GA65_9STRA|nr:unnamed protein product [Cylindrotheca closterium]